MYPYSFKIYEVLAKSNKKSYNIHSIYNTTLGAIQMIIFPIIIVISIVLYVYYKVAIVKSKDAVTQHYFNAKSRICLGSFILFFGINQYLFYLSKFSLAIGIIFVALGSIHIYRGWMESKHYRKEWNRLNPSEGK